MQKMYRLDIADAAAIIAGARAKAKELGVPMCIAVTDESGTLVAFERMDEAKTISVDVAIDKAFTATGTRKGTHELGEASQPGKPVYGLSSTLGGRMVVLAGGLPVEFKGQVAGGVGISGGTAAEDLAVAQAAIDAFPDLSD